MTFDLPEDLAALVRRRAAERGFAGPEEYLAKLIRDDDTDEWWATLSDEERRERDDLARQLREAEASGAPASHEEVIAELARRRMTTAPPGT